MLCVPVIGPPVCFCWQQCLQMVLIHNCLSSFKFLSYALKHIMLHINMEKHMAMALHDILSSSGVAYV